MPDSRSKVTFSSNLDLENILHILLSETSASVEEQYGSRKRNTYQGHEAAELNTRYPRGTVNHVAARKGMADGRDAPKGFGSYPYRLRKFQRPQLPCGIVSRYRGLIAPSLFPRRVP